MFIDNPSKVLLYFAVGGSLSVALTYGFLGLIFERITQRRLAKFLKRKDFEKFSDKPIGNKLMYFMSWLICLLMSYLSAYLVNLSVTNYSELHLGETAQSLIAKFVIIRTPKTISRNELKSVNINQEWTQRKHGPEYWYEVVLETKDGTLLRPNWSISAKNTAEFARLEQFVEELKKLEFPLSFSYKDKQGKTHLTQSITERPE